jgi:hypothetical protein
MPPFPRNMTVSLERANKAAPARLVPGSIKSITWIRLAPILLKGGNLRRSEKKIKNATTVYVGINNLQIPEGAERGGWSNLGHERAKRVVRS